MQLGCADPRFRVQTTVEETESQGARNMARDDRYRLKKKEMCVRVCVYALPMIADA
jgi:hypothetical protein